MKDVNDEFKYFKNEYIDDISRIDTNYMIPIFDDILKKNTFETMVDYGCGDGFFGMYCKEKKHCTIIGVDGSLYALHKAEKRGYDKTIVSEDFNKDTLPIDTGSIDFVLCKDVLEHLLEPSHVLQETHRILNDSGLLLVHVPYHFPLLSRLKFLFTCNIDTQGYFPAASQDEYPHIRFYTFQGLLQLLRKSNFEVVSDYNNYLIMGVPLLSRIPFFNRIIKVLARWSPNNFCIGFTLLCKKH